ncbi:bifunctional coenzyme A synthase [Toxorhynchites rutilus septentrionalis]|uniref:bifunctional coenzyme A synthase n=1 Tax=Toxorhynchites rutilus septentrionalis TaxID=329112 RepID=UPI00247A006C|nr:bifunctional coenzyme A synthase [Toxorhynchites rutilus septentrionalis]
MSSKTGLLTAVHLANISNTLAATRKYALGTLYVQLHPRYKDKARSTALGKLIADVYQSSPTVLAPGVDLRFLVSSLKAGDFIPPKRTLDYLFFDYPIASNVDNSVDPRQVYCGTPQVIELGTQPFAMNDTDFEDLLISTFPNVVLGGTFDRLHAGHKVLLTQAVLLAEERLVVGVTDENMIKSKRLWELILPVEQRIAEVRDFLEEIDTTIRYEAVPIRDPFGPTATDPNMDLIVVSTETARGGAKVNELRVKNGLNQLEVYTIDLLDDESTVDDKEDKISSSNQRMDLLGTRLKPRQPKPHLKSMPYVIGLVGGVASGKSKMAERFRKLGAGVIDCDKVAHELYEPGEDCYQAVINNFGTAIVNEDKTINRKALGAIVFSDQEKLNLLNTILWDAILERTKERIQSLYEKENKQIVIIEAAVLLRAGWQSACHEVWSCIVPKEESVKRLIERNGLSEAEALERCQAQISNTELVKHADVVFCTVWSYEYSQQQAERAWRTLVEDLKLKL